MTDFVIELLRQNPVLLWGLIIVTGAILLLVVVMAARQILIGGEFATPWFTFKPKSAERPTPAPTTTTFQNIINAGSLTLSPQHMEELADRLAEKVREIRQEMKKGPVANFYRPPELPDRIIYLYAVRHDIERKIAAIVLKWGGGWAGVSMASFITFFEYATRFKLIPESLAIEITDFYFYIQPYLNETGVSDSAFLEIQYLAFHINQELDYALANTSWDQRAYEADEPENNINAAG